MSLFENLSAERVAELAPLSPWARFEIPSGEGRTQYACFLEALLEEMLSKADAKNAYPPIHFDSKSGLEGGVGFVYIQNELFAGCKLYWYDGSPRGTPQGFGKGLLLRDHEDKGVMTVHGIFLFVDALVSFLKRKGIAFRLYARIREGRTEILRDSHP